MRLFVGIFPDKQTRDYLRDVKRALAKFKRNLNFVALDQVHLTLKFLGDQIEEEVYADYASLLYNSIKTAGIKPFSFQIDKINFGFRSQLNPTIVHASIKKSEKLDYLVDLSHDSAKLFKKYYINTTKERKKHVNHITLARLKHDTSKAFAARFNEVVKTVPQPDFETKVKSLAFVQSTLTPKGPIYKELSRIDL